MMFFQDAQYPRCAQFIRGPRIETLELISPEIHTALVECCESKKLVMQALSKGTYPRVKIMKFKRNGHIVNNVGGIYMGECYEADRNYVYINEYTARGFEDDRTVALIFERALFHEIVHWARFIGGKPAPIDGKEAGSWFEHRAYGIPYAGHSGLSCPNGEQ